MSLSITKDCFPPADKCHNCERKDSTEIRKQPDHVKEYKRCSNCHVMTYCDQDCQREHWVQVHKSHCRFLSGKTPVKNSKHNATTCVRCLQERESSLTQLRSGNSPKNVCNIEGVTITMKKTLSQVLGFHEEGKKGHCSLKFPCELPFPLGEVSGEYVDEGSNGLDVMLEHSLNILDAMFIKAQKEELKSDINQLWNNIILERSLLWYDILVRGRPLSRSRNHLSNQVDSLKPIYGASCPWWQSLKFSVDFALKTAKNLVSNFYDSDSLEDARFKSLKLVHDYQESQLQNQRIVSENKLWPNLMLWPRLVNGSQLALVLPPSTHCQNCYDELCGEMAVSPHEVNYESLPRLLSDVGDNGALMACCPVTKNTNCIKDCIFKNVKVQIESNLDQRKRFLEETKLFYIESRVCDFCFKASMSSHRCSACRAAQYCSTVCQKKHLEFHKSVCAIWAKDKTRTIKGKDRQKDHWMSVFGKQ